MWTILRRHTKKALQLGAVSVTDITSLWSGEKVCRIIAPFGNLRWTNQRIEEVDFTNPKEIQDIAYIQKSLNEALLHQKNFFEGKA